MKIKSFLLAGTLFFIISGLCQSQKKIPILQDSVQPRQSVLTKPLLKKQKAKSQNERMLNPQPLPPVDAKSNRKGLNPQPEPPGKFKKNRLNSLNPQPLPPIEKGVGKKALNPQPLPPDKSPNKVKINTSKTKSH